MPRSPFSKTPLTHPIKVTFTTTSRGKNPIYPATYVQLSWTYAGEEMFVDNVYTARDIDEENEGENSSSDIENSDESGGRSQRLYSLTIPQENIARKMCKPEEGRDAQVKLYAWRGEKLLGQWELGTVEGAGILRETSQV